MAAWRVFAIVWLAAVLVVGERLEISFERSSCGGDAGCSAECCALASNDCCVEDDEPVLSAPCACGHDDGSLCLHLPALDLPPEPTRCVDDRIQLWTDGSSELGPGRHPAPEPPPPRAWS